MDTENSQTLFLCKTNDAYTMKMLFELLHNTIKIGCFELTQDGIHLCMTDSNRRTLIDITLSSREFNLFVLNCPQLKIGINVHHVYKMMRSIKKKDSMILFIQESNPSDLGIQIIPNNQTRLTTSHVRIQNIQNLEIATPGPYDISVLVSSCEFSKMCKDMLQMSNTIHIKSTRYNVSFICQLGSVYSREVVLGETHITRASSFGGGKCDVLEPIFEDDFDTEQLSRIIKVSSLSSTMNIYCKPEYPMFIHSKIGSIGHIRLYIKSKNQIDMEHTSDHHRVVNTTSVVPLTQQL